MNSIIRQVFVSHPTGKMRGIPSISTSPLCNARCVARNKDGNKVCSHCFGIKGMKMYKNSRDRYAENSELLSSAELLEYQIPVINSTIARLESHGDLINVPHALNYIKICNKNPWCTFAIWTKNPDLLDAAIKEMGKPDNLICVLSSEYLNNVTDLYKKYDWVDKVFTVYTKDYIEDNGVVINCGAKSCINCRMCYTKGNDTFFVNEKLK